MVRRSEEDIISIWAQGSFFFHFFIFHLNFLLMKHLIWKRYLKIWYEIIKYFGSNFPWTLECELHSLHSLTHSLTELSSGFSVLAFWWGRWAMHWTRMSNNLGSTPKPLQRRTHQVCRFARLHPLQKEDQIAHRYSLVACTWNAAPSTDRLGAACWADDLLRWLQALLLHDTVCWTRANRMHSCCQIKINIEVQAQSLNARTFWHEGWGISTIWQEASHSQVINGLMHSHFIAGGVSLGKLKQIIRFGGVSWGGKHLRDLFSTSSLWGTSQLNRKHFERSITWQEKQWSTGILFTIL